MVERREAVVVGVTGHRPNRLKIGAERVVRRLELVLIAIRTGSAGRPRRALSALAEGADRMFAHSALRLGFALDVVLPFERADYETTFSDAAQNEDYRALLARAARVDELPGRLAQAELAYEAVGRRTVEASDLMVAVWDGQPAAGRGGTPEIVDYALESGKAVVWIDASRDRLPVILRSPNDANQGRPALEALAARAKPITHRQIAALV